MFSKVIKEFIQFMVVAVAITMYLGFSVILLRLVGEYNPVVDAICWFLCLLTGFWIIMVLIKWEGIK